MQLTFFSLKVADYVECRPIAVEEVLRHLTSKCIFRSVCSDAHNILTPLQVGVGVPGGCEAIVHAVSQVQEGVTPPEERWTLLLDFSNAFNNIEREHMFQEVRARIPSMAAWMECCYGVRPFLHLYHPQLLQCPAGRPPWSSWVCADTPSYR